MALVTIQVLEGLERGRIFEELPTPVTIGREDDNAIQLNDERVSRFHAKMQEDGERVILTDLDSTNGTRVNGHPVQMRVLQIGDVLSIGRCLLVYGSRQEISACTERPPGDKTIPSIDSSTRHSLLEDEDEDSSEDSSRADAASSGPATTFETLFPQGPPETPNGLSPVQKAQVSDMIAYAHDRIAAIMQVAIQENSAGKKRGKPIVLEWGAWQELLHLEMQLSVYLRKIPEPDP